MQSQPLAIPSFQFSPENPFNEDLLDRRALANKLTPLLQRLKAGSVIAIDAPWGEGKTWFGRNWEAELRRSHKTVFIDAFQHDYIEDPFMLIAAEISTLIKSDATTATKFREKAVDVMKVLMPIGLNIAASIVSSAIMMPGITDAVKKGIEDGIDSADETAQKFLEQKLKDHEKEKRSLSEFRTVLAEYCEAQKSPVIFFIDELDRCSPTFAVKLIERIKHFFDVPNLVFVLLLNRMQLEGAIKGVYGEHTDAATYLNKFVHLFFGLPKKDTFDGTNTNRAYVIEMLKRYQIAITNEVSGFIEEFAYMATFIGMSLRDIEKSIALVAMNQVNSSLSYLAWLVILKIKFPAVFYSITKKNKSGHQAAMDILMRITPPDDYRGWSKNFYTCLHKKYSQGEAALSEEEQGMVNNYMPRGISMYRHDPFELWISKIDVVMGE